MTNKEAIQGLLNVKVQMAEESPFTKAVDLSVEALEKQIPQKPILQADGYYDGELVYDTWLCPNCDTAYEVDIEKHKYCPNCGQAIDWSEEGE